MQKKLLVAAIAGAMVSPSAFAAEGADGMNYVSASEGFYGSLRMRYDTGALEGDEPGIVSSNWSRVGVRGTLDLGMGLTGSYQWETNVSGSSDPGRGGGAQGGDTALRLWNVGISGAFGSVVVGSQTDSLIDLSGRTDVANSISGNFDLTPSYRVDNSIIYRTPDLNGFDASLRLIANPTAAEAVEAVNDANPSVVAVGAETDENQVDDWAVTANYAVQGLSATFAYRVEVDGLDMRAGMDSNSDGDMGDADESMISVDDEASWGLGLGYGQDNWNIAAFYAEQENRTINDDRSVDEASSEIFSVAGDVTVGQTKVYAFTETNANVDGEEGMDNTVSGVGVEYNFTSQSKVWMDYQANDNDASDTEDDRVIVGLRYDF